MADVIGALLIIGALGLAAFVAWRSSRIIRVSSRSPAFLKAGALGGRLLVSAILFPFVLILILWLLLVAKALLGL